MKQRIYFICLLSLSVLIGISGQQNIYGEDFTPDPFVATGSGIAITDFAPFSGDCNFSASYWVSQTMATNCNFPNITAGGTDPETWNISTYNNIEWFPHADIPRTVYERSVEGACPGYYQLNLRAIPKPIEGNVPNPTQVKLSFATVDQQDVELPYADFFLSWTDGWIYHNTEFWLDEDIKSIRVYQETGSYIEEYHDFALDYVNICPIELEQENDFTLQSSGNWIDYCYPSDITLVPELCGDEKYWLVINEIDPANGQTVRSYNSGWLDGLVPDILLNDVWESAYPNEPFRPCYDYEVLIALHALGEHENCTGWVPVGPKTFSFRGFEEDPNFEVLYSLDPCEICIDVEEFVYCDLDNIEWEFTIDGEHIPAYNDKENFCHDFDQDGEYEICMQTTGLVGNLIGVHCDLRETCQTVTINGCSCTCDIMDLAFTSINIDGCSICIDPAEALPANECTTITGYNWNFNDEAYFERETDEPICYAFQSDGVKTITLEVEAVNNLTNETCTKTLSIDQLFENCGGPVCCEVPTPTIAINYLGNCQLALYASYDPTSAQCADNIGHQWLVGGKYYYFEEQGPNIINLFQHGEIEVCLYLLGYDESNNEFCYSETVCTAILIEDECNPVCCSIENPGFSISFDEVDPCTIIVDPNDEIISECVDRLDYFLWTFGEDDQEHYSYTTDPISYSYSSSGTFEVCLHLKGSDFDNNEHCYSETICQTITIENCEGFKRKGEIAQVRKEKDSDLEVTVHPNPAMDNIHVRAFNTSSSLSIRIYNLSGQLLLNQKHHDTQAKLNVSFLDSGLYMLEISDETGKSQLQKIMIL